MDETQDVTIDTTNDEVEETAETPEADTTEGETLETPEVDVAQLQATNKRLFERAKKAEALLKAQKALTKPEAKPTQAPSSSVEETVLLAQGMDESLLGELKVIAKLRTTSLIKAQQDFLFVAAREKLEKDRKSAEAAMPASRGSGSVKAKKTFATPGLSRDEHKAMVLGSR